MKVLLELFQKLVGAAAIGGRASQGAKLLIVRKRHRGVNFGKAERGEPHKWGVPLFPQRLSEIVCPLFSLRPEAQMKTASLRSAGGASAALRLAKKNTP